MVQKKKKDAKNSDAKRKTSNSKPVFTVADNEILTSDEIKRFNLFLLKSERKRMKVLQTKCTRDYRVLNLSEILRAGIGALEKLSAQQLDEVINELKQLK